MLLRYVTDYAGLLAVGFFMGAAGAAFAVGMRFVAGLYARARQGFAVGVYGLGTVGPAIALVVVPRTLDSYAHAALGWGMAALLAAGTAVVWLFSRDAPRAAAPTRYGELLRAGWRLHRLSLFYFVTFGGFVAMFVFLQKLLTVWFSLSTVDAGGRAAGFAALAVAARPVGGWPSDRFARRRSSSPPSPASRSTARRWLRSPPLPP